MPVLAEESLEPYDRFTLHDSPYVAHREGRAIDLFPNDRSGPDGWSVEAPSPVAGRVRDVRAVRAPSRPYAGAEDHLLVVDLDPDGGVRPSVDERPASVEADDAPTYVARILHVEPSVEPGDRLSIGDSLGRLVRSGYFAPWVDNHLHLGIRPADADPVRASGSLRLEVAVGIEPIPWDGSGRVREVGETYAVLDAPDHPAPGAFFVGVEGAPGVALDGGCPHYEGGGLLPGGDGPARLAGYLVGAAEERTVEWAPIEVRANGEPIGGVSTILGRDADHGVKLVRPEHDFDPGERVDVSIHAVEEP